MTFSRGFKLLIALFVVATVALKVAPPARSDNLTQDVIAFLERQHFNVTAADLLVVDDVVDTVNVPVIEAEDKACRLTLATLNFNGSNQKRVERRLAEADRRSVVFRGRFYETQPVWLTAAHHLLSSITIALRLDGHRPPVLAIGSSAACALESLPWGELS